MSFFLNQHLVSWADSTHKHGISSVITDDRHSYLTDLWLILNVSQDVIQWHDYIIQHYYQHSIDIVSHHIIDHDSTRNSHVSHFTVSAISNQIDFNLPMMYHIWLLALYYIIQHYHQHSIECFPIIDHGFQRKHHDYISPATAISIQIDLQFTCDVSHMVAWAVDYVIQHYYETQHWHVVHNRPWIPHTSVMTTFHP